MISNINKIKFSIIVDADACPVVDSIARLALQAEIPVVLIANIAHRLPDYPGVEAINVDNESQAVDMAIVNRVKPRDIVVTQDFGLASIVLGKGAKAISPRGLIYRNDNIESLLLQRHISAKIRLSGGRTKGPKAFKREDLDKFERNLSKLINEPANEHSSPIR